MLTGDAQLATVPALANFHQHRHDDVLANVFNRIQCKRMRQRRLGHLLIVVEQLCQQPPLKIRKILNLEARRRRQERGIGRPPGRVR